MKIKFDKDFEAWYYEQSWNDDDLDKDIAFFYLFQPIFQFGVYQDFGDSVGKSLCVTGVHPVSQYGYSFSINVEHDYTIFDTRQEARQAAIDKFKDWYNEK